MKILYVANIYKHFLTFHVPYLEWLKDQGFKVHVAANGDENVLCADKNFHIPVQRSPYRIENIKAYGQLKKIIDTEKYDIVHCHTPMGGILGRLASRKARKSGTKVIYTAHGFHFHKEASKKNWILYYPVERFMTRYTDALITINDEDFKTAQKFHASKHYSIPGIGVDIDKFKRTKIDRTIKRAELNLSEKDIVLVSVGELSKGKNHETVIKAISRLKDLNVKYIICGEGRLESYLRELSKELGIEEKVIFAGYRSDIGEILKASNIFVFPSLREGLAISGLEAMASGVPVIGSNRRGVADYCIDGKTALVCEPKDDLCIAKSIERLVLEEGLSERLTENAYENIEKFDISNTLKEMKSIYREVAPDLFES